MKFKEIFPVFWLRLLLAFCAACLALPLFGVNSPPLVSTESDPDAFIHNSVNVINGEYCEAATDIIVPGPDALALQRFYSTKDAVTGTQRGGWRIFPQRFLVIGKDPAGKTCVVGKERFDATLAFCGERSGGILPYSGWRSTRGVTKDPLKIDLLNRGMGIVNTYAGEMSGQTNHQNNLLHCQDSTCEVILGACSRDSSKWQSAPLFLRQGTSQFHRAEE